MTLNVFAVTIISLVICCAATLYLRVNDVHNDILIGTEFEGLSYCLVHTDCF